MQIYRETLAGVKGYEAAVEHIFELFTERDSPSRLNRYSPVIAKKYVGT